MSHQAKTNKIFSWLVIASLVVLAAFAWWVISIPGSPNLSSELPEINLTDPSQGAENSAVTIIEFSDFQCEFCRQWNDVYRQLALKYGSRIRRVWKDFPIESVHADAKNAAVAARCAQQQFSFWEFHDGLYQNQDNLGPETYSRIALEIGLDAEKFLNCQGDLAPRKLVESSIREGVAFGVSNTPTLFVDRYVIKEAPSYEFMDNLIAELLSS
ncbi:thioredoxin domain-containing protein [Patescibacteria group bacterium]|nr:thioredoxin domain-containing protein [Patescibacteria group bacterium]